MSSFSPAARLLFFVVVVGFPFFFLSFLPASPPLNILAPRACSFFLPVLSVCVCLYMCCYFIITFCPSSPPRVGEKRPHLIQFVTTRPNPPLPPPKKSLFFSPCPFYYLQLKLNKTCLPACLPACCLPRTTAAASQPRPPPAPRANRKARPQPPKNGKKTHKIALLPLFFSPSTHHPLQHSLPQQQ